MVVSMVVSMVACSVGSWAHKMVAWKARLSVYPKVAAMAGKKVDVTAGQLGETRVGELAASWVASMVDQSGGSSVDLMVAMLVFATAGQWEHKRAD